MKLQFQTLNNQVRTWLNKILKLGHNNICDVI
jgi:hypothetical protein